MIVLAFDPSTTRTGWALCERVAGRFARLRSGALTPDKSPSAWARLVSLADAIRWMCEEVAPADLDIVVVENPGRSKILYAAAGVTVGVARRHCERVDVPHTAKWTNEWARAHGCGNSKETRLERLCALLPEYDLSRDPGGDEGDAICLAMWRLEQED